jgi:putative hydrolase of the HAD superfamily
MPLEALILDYGNVLSHPQPRDWCQTVASQIGVPTETFRDAYWQHRRLYDAGLPAAEYWRRVLETLGYSAAASDLGAITDRLVEADVASWTEYREDVWHLAASFRLTGGRTAFLSNGVADAMARIRADRRLERWFDVVVVSCEVGASKPDPAIFEMCLAQLGVTPRQALFVDDRIENIEGAARLGIQTFHFVGTDAVSRLSQSVRSLSG